MLCPCLGESIIRGSTVQYIIIILRKSMYGMYTCACIDSVEGVLDYVLCMLDVQVCMYMSVVRMYVCICLWCVCMYLACAMYSECMNSNAHVYLYRYCTCQVHTYAPQTYYIYILVHPAYIGHKDINSVNVWIQMHMCTFTVCTLIFTRCLFTDIGF